MESTLHLCCPEGPLGALCIILTAAPGRKQSSSMVNAVQGIVWKSLTDRYQTVYFSVEVKRKQWKMSLSSVLGQLLGSFQCPGPIKVLLLGSRVGKEAGKCVRVHLCLSTWEANEERVSEQELEPSLCWGHMYWAIIRVCCEVPLKGKS